MTYHISHTSSRFQKMPLSIHKTYEIEGDETTALSWVKKHIVSDMGDETCSNLQSHERTIVTKAKDGSYTIRFFLPNKREEYRVRPISASRTLK